MLRLTLVRTATVTSRWLTLYPAQCVQRLTVSFSDKEVAERSVLIKNLLEDMGEEATTTETIPIPNVCYAEVNTLRTQVDCVMQVNEAVLKKVIEWCTHHRSDPPATADDDSDSRKKTTDIEEWDQKFMQVDQEMLFEIILVGSIHSSH